VFGIARRRLWKSLRMWRFRLFQRHRFRRLVLETAGDRSFLVLPQVFNPALFQTGALLAALVDRGLVSSGTSVLDLGTGSGICAVAAAAHAAHVVAIDIEPEAVRCARINAALNGVEDRVDVRLGDLFEPVRDERFDLVLFNPPYIRGVPLEPFDRAFKSRDVASRFAAGLAHHLTPKGRAILLLSSDGDASQFLDALASRGFAANVLAQRDLRHELVTIYAFSLPC
jgi:release factor glutamine methyltransferase